MTIIVLIDFFIVVILLTTISVGIGYLWLLIGYDLIKKEFLITAL